MTCGNDTKEGGASVPEPGTLLRFGGGLFGFAFHTKRPAKKHMHSMPDLLQKDGTKVLQLYSHDSLKVNVTLLIPEVHMVYHSGQFRKDGRNLIGTIPFFSTLSREESDQVEQIIRKRSFTREQVVLNEEETSKFMYIIYAGKVRVVKKGEDGREQILCIHKKGDFFGEMSLLDGETAPATIIAHEDAIIGLLNKNDFEDHIMSHDIIRRKIIDMLCFRLRDAWKMIKILSFDNAEHRVMIVLDHLREIYGIKDGRGIIINIKTTHRMIANFAAVSRETATRKLNKLEKSGVIETLENKNILLKESFFQLASELTFQRRPS